MRSATLGRRLAPAAILAAALVALPLAIALAARPPEPSAGPVGPAQSAPPTDLAPAEALAAASRQAPLAKLAPALRDIARAGRPDRDAWLTVLADRPVDVSPFTDVAHSFTWPAGEHVTLLRAPQSALLALAALPGVARVAPMDPAATAQLHTRHVRATGKSPAAPKASVMGPVKGAATDNRRAHRATDAPLGQQPAGADLPPGDRSAAREGPLPTGWWDVGAGHGGEDAWALGYRGAGVRVAVLDTGVDFAHPDLQGTWAVLPDGHPYAGWPQAYDPYGVYFYALDKMPGSRSSFTSQAYGGLVAMSQESAVISQTVGTEAKATACLRPLVWADPDADTRVLGPEDCDTRVPPSQSGRVRYGHHPDTVLAGLSAAEDGPGEFPGVLLVDALAAGIYDTVYVDLDGDHDFTDEKPMTRDDPAGWRDTDGDDLADLSGGMLYYIADGKLPVPGAWLWGMEQIVPAAYSYVALMVDVGEHGTLCASDIVSQGRLGVPPGVNLGLRDLPDGPAALNPALAPEARVVAVGDVYGPDILFDTAWRFAVLGTDPGRSDDDIQVASNSYGWGAVDNEGWDPYSRTVDHYVRRFSPSTTFVVATGNGAPGYGTVNSPLPVTGIAVGASTQNGHTGSDSITDTLQITYGDVTAFSNRGPASDSRVGVDLVANGANGVGAIPLNMAYDPEAGAGGAAALISWGGTSRSAPVTAAGLALVYQAYRAKAGRWPDWGRAKGLLLGGARFNGYDAFTTGAGTLDAGDAARLAAGRGGLYAMPATWSPGTYRGRVYPAFAKLIWPGQSDSQTITITNASTATMTADLSVKTMRRLTFYEQDLTTDLAAESPYNYNVPDYVVPIDRNKVPPGTDLMVVRFIYPLSELDPDDDLVADNDFRPAVLQHVDVDRDGQLWDDADGNGVVNHATIPDEVTGLDGDPAVDWGRTELDRWEYARFDRSSAEANTAAVSVHHPLERWRDGLYVALWHRRPGEQPIPVRQTHVRFRVECYSYVDWPWFVLGRRQVTLGPGASVGVLATLQVPRDTVAGAYQGAVFADYARPAGDRAAPTGGGYEREGRRLTVPVGLNVAVAHDWQGTVTVGNTVATPSDLPYALGAVRGYQDWSWDWESGDWRLFFLDSALPTPAGTYWLMKTGWSDPSRRQTDIDTRLWGAAPDRFTNADDPANAVDDWSDPAWYGPFGLAQTGASDKQWEGAGRWRFDTATGTNEDWVGGAAGDGLSAMMLHNVLYSGAQFEVPFTVQVSTVRIEPGPLVGYAGACLAMTVTSQVDLPGLKAMAVGIAGPPETLADQPVGQDDPTDPGSAGLRVPITVTGQAAGFRVALAGPPAADVDLYVLYDADRDGQVAYPDDVVGASQGGGAEEEVNLAGLRPGGHYEAWVHGYRVPGGEDLATVTVDVIAGEGLAVKNAPTELRAGKAVPMGLCPRSAVGLPEQGRGVLILGPGIAPYALRAAVTWQATARTQPIFLPIVLRKHYFLYQ